MCWTDTRVAFGYISCYLLILTFPHYCLNIHFILISHAVVLCCYCNILLIITWNIFHLISFKLIIFTFNLLILLFLIFDSPWLCKCQNIKLRSWGPIYRMALTKGTFTCSSSNLFLWALVLGPNSAGRPHQEVYQHNAECWWGRVSSLRASGISCDNSLVRFVFEFVQTHTNSNPLVCD